MLPSSTCAVGTKAIRHAAVCGASGFIGRYLCRELQRRGIEVTALNRRSQSGPWDQELLHDLDGAVKLTLPDGVDSIFHLAGFAHAQPNAMTDALHHAITVNGTVRLLEACPPTVQRFVYFSSVKAMGESTSTSCIDETHELRPSTAYGHARLLAERRVLANAARMHTSILRLPLVYGPGVKGNLDRLLKAVCKRRLPVFPEFGNRRSMVHVADVVSAALAAAEQRCAAGQTYLLCDGQRYSTRAIQLSMYAAVGVQHPVLRLPRVALRVIANVGDLLQVLGMKAAPFNSSLLAKLAESACYDATRARAELGWSPQHTLDEALPSMLKALTEESIVGG
ncbi:MAG: UDP-glucose 4-epimerase [Gammaproteobacteria bacterium]|jgi:UDP-glucose 4-epimerase